MKLNTWYEGGLVVGVLFAWGCGGESLVPLPSRFQMVDAGNLHSCGIVTDGAAYCWGNNDFGQIGDGSRTSHVYPARVVGSVSYSTLSAGSGHTCAIATTGAAYCWGFNLNGQLGDETQTDRATPALVRGDKDWLSLSAGGSYTCGIATDSLAYCWGWNDFGQLGDGTTTDRPAPTAVSGAHKFQTIGTNAHHTCGLTFAGEAYCWGFNEFGQLGSGDADDSSTPLLVSGGGTWAALDVGFSHTCGIAADGSGYCWGRNHFGQLGVGDTVGGGNQTLPFPMAGEITWISLNLGGYFGCGLQAQTDAAFCWGYNGSWQLGGNAPDDCSDEGTTTNCALSPFAVTGGLSFATISAHTQHTCGLSTDGVAYCWGSGTMGQLGNGEKGTQIYAPEPVRVAGQP